MLSTAIHQLHDLFHRMRFFHGIRHPSGEATAFNPFSVPLFVVTKKVLHSKTLLEHCILAEVGVCYRSVGEVETARAWGSLRCANAKSGRCWSVGLPAIAPLTKWRTKKFRLGHGDSESSG